MKTDHTFDSFDGTKIAYRVWGEGTELAPLLCCSGIACNDCYWRYLAPDLASERKVITWDYPYHGDSSEAGDPTEISVRSLARHAVEVLTATGLEAAAVAGHSMGVQVILEMYRIAPERVLAMIPIAGPFSRTVGGLYGTGAGVHLLNLLEATANLQPDLVKAAWRLGVNHKIADPVGRAGGLIGQAPTEVMKEYFDHVAGLDPQILFAMFREGHEHSAEDILDSIDVPVLILHGTADVMSPFALAEEMSRRIPGAELVAIENGAHTLPVEDPPLINGEVRRFLKTRVDPRVATRPDTPF